MPPGIVFSAFMVSVMVGSTLFGWAHQRSWRVEAILAGIYALSAVALAVPVSLLAPSGVGSVGSVDSVSGVGSFSASQSLVDVVTAMPGMSAVPGSMVHLGAILGAFCVFEVSCGVYVFEDARRRNEKRADEKKRTGVNR